MRCLRHWQPAAPSRGRNSHMASSVVAAQLVSGPLVFDTVPDIYSASRKWFEGAGDVVLDLGAVTQADSAGLGLMVEWLRMGRAAGRNVKFVNIPSQMRVLISVNGLQNSLLGGTPD